MLEPTIYELSQPGRRGTRFPRVDVPETPVPEQFQREDLAFPELTEVDCIRHFTHLSRLNYSIDEGIYPLGSCTMKYNPRINEAMARLSGFIDVHPLQPEETVQGALKLMYTLQTWLAEIGGFDAATLQPAAGAHGELTGILIMRAWHLHRGQHQRTRVIIPDSAHGTNPATSAMAGMEVISVATDSKGNIELESLRKVCDETTAGIMITNPNTLGLFDQNYKEVIDLVHNAGGLVYGDGANMNALLGYARPGDFGVDIMHYNLHKTFSTPHGGGGPGSGPVVVKAPLRDFLPGPVVVKDPGTEEDSHVTYRFSTPPHSIGRMKAFHGHFGMLVRAYTYIAMYGGDGLPRIAENAVLSANYLLASLRDLYKVPFDRVCMHEFVVEGRWPECPDVQALDISKRLMDYGIHPPTNYFPLIVHDALMIEPTETENLASLDRFIEVMREIAREAHESPELLKSSPHTSPIGRLDEVKAARDLVLCCSIPEDRE